MSEGRSTRDRAARQLAFDLSREPCFDPDDFLSSPTNAAALAAVRSWPHWAGRTLLLLGPPGSGKSHLAAIWAAEVGAKSLHPVDGVAPPNLAGDGRPYLIEDCDRLRLAEAAFFHTLNLVRETDGWLLMTARTVPGAWGVATPDLLSRLRLCPAVSIDPPDSLLMKSVLVKLFTDRQIMIDEDVVSYAARHCEQSLGAAREFVCAVDEAALAAGRRITRPLAAETLARLQSDDAG